MKWFKHESDAHTNMKLQALIDKLGVAGYGYYWACVELVANQGGDEFKITKNKHWEQHLKKMLNIEPKDQKKYLVVLATHNLIDLKALKKGDLYNNKLLPLILKRQAAAKAEAISAQRALKADTQSKTKHSKYKHAYNSSSPRPSSCSEIHTICMLS